MTWCRGPLDPTGGRPCRLVAGRGGGGALGGGQLAVWSTAQLRARTEHQINRRRPVPAALSLGGRGPRRQRVGARPRRQASEAPHLYREASPWAQEPLTRMWWPSTPPDGDDCVCVVSRRYVTRMTERGQSAELVEVPDEGHSAFLRPRDARTAKPPVCSVSERADIEVGLSVDAG